MIAMIVKELKLIRKDMRSFFFLLLMPALFIMLFGSVFGSSSESPSISIHVIDQDQSQASRSFIDQMNRIMKVEQDPADSLDKQIEKIKQGQFSAVLVIPSGFEPAMKQGKQTDIKLYLDPAAQSSTAPIQAILKSISEQYRERKLAGELIAKGDSPAEAEEALKSPIRVQDVPTTSDHFNYVDQLVPGMTVMFVFFIMITISRRLFEEKKTGLLSRIRSTTVKPLQYLIGMWIPFVLTVIVQCVILFSFGHYVYGLNLGDLGALGLIVLGLSIAGTGLGLGLTFLVPGESSAMVFTQLISMGGAMVGGLWMPSYLLPDIVQKIGHFTPQYWAQHSLQNIIAHGAQIGDILGGFAVLVAFGLAGLLVALLRLPVFMRSAAN